MQINFKIVFISVIAFLISTTRSVAQGVDSIIIEDGINIKRTHFQEISSTQTHSVDTIKLESSDKKTWRLITARIQTNGIGTHKRKWRSDIPGNIYASLTMPVKVKNRSNLIKNNMMLRLVQIPALAVHETVKEFFEAANSQKVSSVKLKWPNDVIVDGKKISGVMCSCFEMPGEEGYLQVTVGIGLNVNVGADILETIDQPATSMSLESNRSFDEEDVLRVILKKMVKLTKYYDEHEDRFANDFFSKISFHGDEVIVHDDSSNRDVTGIMEGIDSDGFLKLRELSTQDIITVMSGTLRRK